jgi:hypothetical protein
MRISRRSTLDLIAILLTLPDDFFLLALPDGFLKLLLLL